jgi:EAL domain-containing protein (putative c-di-GMP-specific phosphodiesterase class I)
MELVVHYQAQFGMLLTVQVGGSADRWRHPPKQLLQPHDFLPLAVKCGLPRRLIDG